MCRRGRQRGWGVLAAILLILYLCGTAQANSLAPYAYFWPGVVFILPEYALPVTILAAFIERPFLSAAGINSKNALLLALRANALSTLLGLLLIPAAVLALETMSILWCLAAFAITCWVELRYLRGATLEPIRRDLILFGNGVSSIVLPLIPPVAAGIEEVHRGLAYNLRTFQHVLAPAATLTSLTVLIGSFLWPLRRGSAVNTGGATQQPELPASAVPQKSMPNTLEAG